MSGPVLPRNFHRLPLPSKSEPGPGELVPHYLHEQRQDIGGGEFPAGRHPVAFAKGTADCLA